MTATRLAAAVGLLALAGCHPPSVETPLTGAELYRACGACHGEQGEGNLSIHAPAIAGLPQWYLSTQLHNFRTGMRGAHPDDIEGLRMRPMSRQMKTEAELTAVIGYVASLKPVHPETTLKGDPEKGKLSYAACGACHAANGAGMEMMHAPPLNTQADWYLLAQLKKFKEGVRGTAQGDVMGATMRPMSMTLPDEAAMINVVAYISAMPK